MNPLLTVWLVIPQGGGPARIFLDEKVARVEAESCAGLVIPLFADADLLRQRLVEREFLEQSNVRVEID